MSKRISMSKIGSISGAEAGASARGQHCWADCRVEWFHITSALHEKTSEIQKHKPLQPYTRDWYQQQIVWDWYTQPYYIHSYVQVSILQTQCLQVQQACRIWLVQYINDSLRISSSIYELEAYLRQAAQPRRGPKCSHPKVNNSRRALRVFKTVCIEGNWVIETPVKKEG